MSVVVGAVARALGPATRTWVEQATAASQFAGPDGHGVKVDEGWALGHALLRTGPNVAGGPLTLDGRVWLSADVRLDDRAGLRAALRARGRDVEANADDAELVLWAYAVWGAQFLDHLAGDFAFALWDGGRRRLLCARDQLGVLPLHYATLDDGLLVAASPEILLLHPALSDRLDEATVADFLLTGHPSDMGASTFADIRRLPPAHILTWTAGEVRLRRYWRQPEFAPLLRYRRREDYAAHFRHLLGLAVADRVTSEPLAAQLSGGMDSTAVTALAHRARSSLGAADGSMRCVTAVLGGDSDDREGEYASLVAQPLGLPLDVLDESQMEATDPFAEPPLLTPEPTPYQWTGLEYRIAEVAAERGRTCLTGLGGDPLLGFLPWYWAEWLARGRAVRLAAALVDGVRLFGERPHPHLRQTAGALWSSRAAKCPPLPQWLAREFALRTDAAARWRVAHRSPSWRWDRRELTHDPAWPTWFTWGDPSYTRLPLRLRHPMIDLRLLDFVAQVAPDPWLLDKRILREATGGLLPEVVRRRAKAPLVCAQRVGRTKEARLVLGEFVRATPQADGYLDREALISALGQSVLSPGQERALARPLGLMHWLAHWRRPHAA